MQRDPDGRLHAPSAERNNRPIRDCIAGLLGIPGPVLDIGCGTGQHAALIAADHPQRAVLPTDVESENLASAVAWGASLRVGNLCTPRLIDAGTDWAPQVADMAPFALVLAVNVLHITPWTVAEGLVAGAARVLAPGGVLALYGPFIERDRPLAASNVAFDASLKARDPGWGLRAVDDVAALAAAVGLDGPRVTEMPANNLVLSFWRPLSAP